jgi:hypothetical protein
VGQQKRPPTRELDIPIHIIQWNLNGPQFQANNRGLCNESANPLTYLILWVETQFSDGCPAFLEPSERTDFEIIVRILWSSISPPYFLKGTYLQAFPGIIQSAEEIGILDQMNERQNCHWLLDQPWFHSVVHGRPDETIIEFTMNSLIRFTIQAKVWVRR